jgi:CheY-like chemotaxis protein
LVSGIPQRDVALRRVAAVGVNRELEFGRMEQRGSMSEHLARPYQLLIADDDRAFRETLVEIFAPHFATVVAESGEEALEVFQQTPVDIALLDMYMHELTGLETLRLLKKQANVPCILITADATEELCRDASRADAFRVLHKPVRRTELVATVSAAIDVTYDDPTFGGLLA